MEGYRRSGKEGKTVFVGVDLHRFKWHVTVRKEDEELLVELQDVARFRRAEQLAAYVGLTPSQYSSAEKIRMGRITGIGKSGLRGTLVEASWKLITKDGAMGEKYERIKARSGAKRAIVAIARTLLLRTRRMLLDGNPYAVGLLA